MTFVAALPLILALLCGILDLGRTVFLCMELENAATSVCRDIKDKSLTVMDEDLLVARACVASPSLSVSNLGLAAEVAFEDPEEGSYVHRLYDQGGGGFSERLSHTKTRRFEVMLTIRGAYLTPIGGLTVQSLGDTADFEFVARSVGFVDETVEGGGW